MSMPNFEGNVWQLQEGIKFNDDVPFAIPFTGDSSQIDYVYGTCPACTTVKVDRENNKVYGFIRVPNAGIPNTPGTHNLIKTVKICFDPQEPEFKADEDGTRIGNDLKKSLVIQIRGKVTIPE